MDFAKQSTDRKVELMMTPMIDVVFQLLVFFLITFKVIAPEGDFTVRMPATGPPANSIEALLPIRVHLAADERGELKQISVNNSNMGVDYDRLQGFVAQYVGDERGPERARESAEVEFDCDYHLRYEYTIQAITAVSGYRDANGNIVKLVDKIRFTPPPKLGPG